MNLMANCLKIIALCAQESLKRFRKAASGLSDPFPRLKGNVVASALNT